MGPRQRSGFLIFASVGVTSLGLSALSWNAPGRNLTQIPEPSAEQTVFFETKIRPLLVTQCTGCHGATSQSASLRLDARSGFEKGGASGAVVVPGNPDKSLLIQVVRYSGPIKMPMGGKLKPQEIADLEAWVKMGAPWPKAGDKVATKAPLWSLQPVRNPAPPKVKATTWVRNPVDAFVLAKLEAKGMSPALEADRRTLLRRVSYDLTGLPPNFAEINAFLADKSPNAYEKVVDRLLTSPRYGERWARLWLDVARYADTKGYVFVEDRNYPNAYTYREWVINAFNADLPYDQFITQQIAADRLPGIMDRDDRSALAGMGFLTLGRRFLNSTPDIIDDRIDVTMRGFQGFTVACARCHDHKFDPIPTQDYYSLYSVFDSSDEQTIATSTKSVREPWEAYNTKVAQLQSEHDRLISEQVKALRAKPMEGFTPEVRETLQSFRENELPDGDKQRKLLPAFEGPARNRVQETERILGELRKSPPATPKMAMAMVDRGNGHDVRVFKRGNQGNPGDVAPRRFLAALSKAERATWSNGSGRLELAKSIASKDNPLTARVFVNRVWMHHFGAGLVRTPSDFGYQGEKPTHPELLDYLATRFMADGWSIKKLHRLIVLSNTYRQSSESTTAKFNADPENRLLSHMTRRRLDLEQMRDTLVAVAGKLQAEPVGGQSVDLWSAPFTGRRAVYGFVERQNLPGIFRTFDFASPDSTSARRFQTTVPQQALFFMNAPFAVEQARNVAMRPEIMGTLDAGQRIRRLYLLLLGRLPDANEAALGVKYLSGAAPHRAADIWTYGYGGLDASTKKLNFTPFAAFGDNAYRPGNTFPDPTYGYATLNAFGGHPGRDGAHAVIRRWTAPAAMTVRIGGSLHHPAKEGDGVRARVFSERRGLLGEWVAKNRRVSTYVAQVEVQKGETINFVVDPQSSDGFDSFEWSPVVELLDKTKQWASRDQFSPPPPPPVDRLTLYAQALMMSNEFMFVD